MKTRPVQPTYLLVVPWSLEHQGGVNNVVINLAHEINRVGTFEPLVLIVDWGSIDPVWGQSHGLTTVRWRIRSPLDGDGLKGHLGYYLWLPRFMAAFRAFCAEHRVSTINIHYPGPHAFFFGRFARNSVNSIRLLLSFHGSDIDSIKSAPARTIIRWKQLLQDGPTVVACSNNLSDRIRAVFGDGIKPVIVYNGIDASAFARMAGEPPEDPVRVILSVGKFIRLKGHDVLIEAFAAIAATHKDVMLAIVGATGDDLPTLQQLASSKLNPAQIKLLADVPHANIAPLFRSASVFVLASRQEAFPIVLLEAGCLGLPVIATSVGGIPELIVDGETGILVPPDDPTALAQSIRHVLGSPNISHTLGEHLRQRVIGDFTWTRAAEQYMQIASN
ncbi:MAG: glycosyltransferase family 4 protein [Rhodoferax sp.]|nr:glycosyltransferase family 4 protein [Rhodoferax sp.]